MTALDDALSRLVQYNANGDYNAASNRYSFLGIGGMEANYVQSLRDVASAAVSAGTLVGQIAAAQSTIAMVWDAGTADADPGAGEVRASTAALTAGTYTLYIDTVDADGVDATNVIAGWVASTSTVKGRLRLVKVGDSAAYVDVNVTAVTVATGYRKVAVSYVSGPGGFAAGDRVAIGFSRTGDKGDTGNTGATGPTPVIVSASTTSLAIGTGAKTLVTAAALGLGVGANILVASTANAANYMFGNITAISGTSVTFNSTVIGGSGTLASWNVSQSGVQGPQGIQGNTGAAGGITGGNATGAINETAVTLASAATTDLGAAAGNAVRITGTTNITALGTAQAGSRRHVTFSGVLTLTHNATSLILPGAVNILTANGDTAEFESLGAGNWRCMEYNYVTGLSVGLGTTAFASGALTLNMGGRSYAEFVYTATANITSVSIINSPNNGTSVALLRLTNGGAFTYAHPANTVAEGGVTAGIGALTASGTDELLYRTNSDNSRIVVSVKKDVKA
ncbi:hypothetical protein M5E06_20880 [Azospirillum sp. A1-3]|uniref:hypothetical protein n=1 Tax=Azospirillum sp. A1-3 TaxID=185874 RepID=UPI00207750FA|nr:hypothetical protein [Azospirillum sp. A1-3]MCM8736585.1 hypothetical protein [Azospirillum sp. A1-3]